MAKTKRPAKPKDDEQEKLWEIFARIDPSLREPIRRYIASQKYPPALARVIEHAFRLLLETESREQKPS